MTATEKSVATRRGLLYGVWCAVTVALPSQFVTLGLVTGKLNSLIAIACGLLVIAHVVCLPKWLRRQRQFLCNTQWARENQIEPEQLKLFCWRGILELR